MHAIAAPHALVAVDLEPDELVAGVLFALGQRCPADEVLVLGLQGNREADAGLEGIRLVGELMVEEDQARLDAQHVERLEPQRRDAVLAAFLPHCVEHAERIFRVTEHFVAEFTRITGARDNDRKPLEAADAAYAKPEPLQLADRRLGGRRPDDLFRRSRLFGPCTAILCN